MLLVGITIFNFALNSSSALLNEVVVIGFGSSTKKEITGAGGDSEKYFKPFRHALVISNLLQLGNLESLKKGLIEGAKGKWLNELQPDTFLYQSDEHTDFQAYGNSLNWFYPTIMPLLEAHIVLQQNNIYTTVLLYGSKRQYS